MSEKLATDFGFGNSSADDDDPLAELARIVAGEPEPEYETVSSALPQDSLAQTWSDVEEHSHRNAHADPAPPVVTDNDVADELDRALEDALGADFITDDQDPPVDHPMNEFPEEARGISDAIANLDHGVQAVPETIDAPQPHAAHSESAQFEDDLINALNGDIDSSENSQPESVPQTDDQPAVEAVAAPFEDAIEADLSDFEAALSAELNVDPVPSENFKPESVVEADDQPAMGAVSESFEDAIAADLSSFQADLSAELNSASLSPESPENSDEAVPVEEVFVSGQNFADAFNQEFEQIRTENDDDVSSLAPYHADNQSVPKPVVPQPIETPEIEPRPVVDAQEITPVMPELEDPAQVIESMDDLDFGSAFAEELGVEKVEEFSGWSEADNQLAAAQFAEGASSNVEPSRGEDDPGYLAGVDVYPEHDEAFHDDYHEQQNPGSRRFAIAALVIALFGGSIVAGYGFLGGENGGLGSAEPKLIKAGPEPVKVKPDDPGGKIVANQDKASYERVAGEENEPVFQERLISNTEEPAKIASSSIEESIPAEKATDRLNASDVEDEPVSQTQISSVQPRVVQTVTVRPDGTIVQAAQETPVVSQIEQQTIVNAGDEVTDKQIQLGEALDATVKPVETEVIKPQEPIDDAVSRGGIGIPVASPLPKPAVQGIAETTNPAPVSSQSEPVQLVSVEPTTTNDATVQRSEWVVQVSSQRSAEAAQSSYQNLSNRFSILRGRPMSIQRAIVNGVTFYRARMQTSSKTDANQLCSNLKAAGGSCFVTR